MAAGKVKRGRRIMDPDEREAFAAQRREEDRERIESAVRALASSEGWMQWMNTRARFHNYSLGNQLLIAMQCPEATRVAGYRVWQSMGRQVLKGQRGIRIMAPMSFKVKGGESKRAGLSTPASASAVAATARTSIYDGGRDSDDETRVGFRAVSVFDLSQTDGDPLPELATEPITGDGLAHYLPPLVKLAAEIGYSVTLEDIPGAAGGYCDYTNKRIVVEASEPENAQVRTLVHEIAHALGVGYKEYGRGDAEVIVDSVAFIVLSSLGLDISGESVPYVAGWCDGNPDALKAHAATVDELAKRIETALCLDELEMAVAA